MYLILQAIAVQHCQIPSLRGIHTPQLGTFSYQLSILHMDIYSQSQLHPLLSLRHPNTWVLFAGLRRIGPTPRSTGQREEKKREAREPLASTKIPTDVGERQVRGLLFVLQRCILLLPTAAGCVADAICLCLGFYFYFFLRIYFWFEKCLYCCAYRY